LDDSRVFEIFERSGLTEDVVPVKSFA